MFPENLNEREKYIFDQVVAGNFEARYEEVERTCQGRRVKLLVMDDALKVDGVRVNVSARLSQRLADTFDASLPTALIADLMYASATRRARPCPQTISSSVAAMLKHHTQVESQIGQVKTGLSATVGKHWVIDKQLESKATQACNYGWHFEGDSFQGIKGYPNSSGVAGKDVHVIQPNATAHDFNHTDYSQICQLVSQQCWVDGIQMRLSDVIKSTNDAFLVSHQGPLKIDRQPGVPLQTGQYVMFPIVVTP